MDMANMILNNYFYGFYLNFRMIFRAENAYYGTQAEFRVHKSPKKLYSPNIIKIKSISTNPQSLNNDRTLKIAVL